MFFEMINKSSKPPARLRRRKRDAATASVKRQATASDGTRVNNGKRASGQFVPTQPTTWRDGQIPGETGHPRP